MGFFILIPGDIPGKFLSFLTIFRSHEMLSLRYYEIPFNLNQFNSFSIAQIELGKWNQGERGVLFWFLFVLMLALPLHLAALLLLAFPRWHWGSVIRPAGSFLSAAVCHVSQLTNVLRRIRQSFGPFHVLPLRALLTCGSWQGCWTLAVSLVNFKFVECGHFDLLKIHTAEMLKFGTSLAWKSNKTHWLPVIF